MIGVQVAGHSALMNTLALGVPLVLCVAVWLLMRHEVRADARRRARWSAPAPRSNVVPLRRRERSC